MQRAAVAAVGDGARLKSGDSAAPMVPVEEARKRLEMGKDYCASEGDGVTVAGEQSSCGCKVIAAAAVEVEVEAAVDSWSRQWNEKKLGRYGDVVGHELKWVEGVVDVVDAQDASNEVKNSGGMEVRVIAAGAPNVRIVVVVVVVVQQSRVPANGRSCSAGIEMCTGSIDYCNVSSRRKYISIV